MMLKREPQAAVTDAADQRKSVSSRHMRCNKMASLRKRVAGTVQDLKFQGMSWSIWEMGQRSAMRCSVWDSHPWSPIASRIVAVGTASPAI